MNNKHKPIQSEPIKVRDGDTEEAILKEAQDRATIAYQGWKENFEVSREDVTFIAGVQWSKKEKDARTAEGKISLILNKLPQFVNRVIGAQRKNVQSIKVSPRSSAKGKERTLTTEKGEELKASRVVSDFIRNIEYQSNAKGAYKMAFKHALEGGFGWLRVYTAYQDDGFDMDIKIKGIRNRYSVYIDPRATEDDYSDMNFAFITETMTNAEFNKRYPSASKGGLQITNDMTSTFWYGTDTVTVAEYFRREPIKKKIALLSNGEIVDAKDLEDDVIMEKLEDMGITVVKTRTINSYKVIWCKISGMNILEKEREFPTTTIPVVPVLGREIDYDNERAFRGLTYDAKDGQRMFNATRSSAMERVNLVTKTPYIGTADAVKGYEREWATANTENRGILVHNKGTNAPQRQPMAAVPTGEMSISNELNNDIQQSIGIYDASLGAKSNETSGKAIQARQGEADTGTFEYIDNLGTAIRRVGILCVELIPKIYDTNRVIQLRNQDGTDDTVEINKAEQVGGEEEVTNDLDGLKYDVVVETGASYATKQEESADQILDLMRVNPKVAEVGSDILIKNLDFADSDVLADRMKKTLPANVLSKEDQKEISKDMPEPQPSPEQIKANADIKLKEMDMQMKDTELKAGTEIEAIKLETARVNLAAKKLDLAGKQKENEEKRKDGVVNTVIDQIKKSKAAK